MSETPKALEQMLNAWNELDPDAVRGHLDKALAEDVVFIDPTHSTVGRDAFETMVHDFRAQFPPGSLFALERDRRPSQPLPLQLENPPGRGVVGPGFRRGRNQRCRPGVSGRRFFRPATPSGRGLDRV